MKLIIGSKSIEIKDAIRQLQLNIQWLKRSVIIVSKCAADEKTIHFYTQKIETQQALIACLSRYDAVYNHSQKIGKMQVGSECCLH
ncbi:MAG: hypothetical protein V4732_18365 [Pseudomonadota bacterium]